MIFKLSLLILFSCFLLSTSISLITSPSFLNPSIFIHTDNSSDNDDFLTIATAILQNKNSFSDPVSYSSTFSYWQLAGFLQKDVFKDNFEFEMNKGLIAQIWQKPKNSSSLWTFNLRFFDGNYTDQNEVIARIQTFNNQKGMEINPSNATIVVSDLKVLYQNQATMKSVSYPTELSIYFVDRNTQKPPLTFDISNLKAYTKQFRLIIKSTGQSEYITSFFDTSYEISQKDKIIVLIGSLVYILISLSSINLHKPNTRPVSNISIKLLIFFPVYIISYLISWFVNLSLSRDLFYPVIPIIFAVLLDLGKHLIELYKLHDKDWWWICVYPVLTLIFVGFPGVSFYIGDLISSLYLLPQIILKFQERHSRFKHLTWFEIGNWICISLWVSYTNFYQDNVFLSSPKPTLVLTHAITILIQFGVLGYLQCVASRRKRYKYSFVADPTSQESLLNEECSICIQGLNINEGERIYKTPCGHFFHPECLKSWGGTKLICPVCRTKIPDLVYPID